MFYFSSVKRLENHGNIHLSEVLLFIRPLQACEILLNSGIGKAIVLSNRFPSDETTWRIDRQFLWGSSLLISPALEKVEYNQI